jgi:hypothetical protein
VLLTLGVSCRLEKPQLNEGSQRHYLKVQEDRGASVVNSGWQADKVENRDGVIVVQASCSVGFLIKAGQYLQS